MEVGFHLEDEARSLPRQEVDQVGGRQEANLPTCATPDDQSSLQST